VTKKVAEWNNNNPVVQMAAAVPDDDLGSYSDSNSSADSPVTVKPASSVATQPVKPGFRPIFPVRPGFGPKPAIPGASAAGDVKLPPLHPPGPSPGINPDTDEKTIVTVQTEDPSKSILGVGDGKKSDKDKKSKGKGKKKKKQKKKSKSKSRSKSSKRKSSKRRDTETTLDSSVSQYRLEFSPLDISWVKIVSYL